MTETCRCVYPDKCFCPPEAKNASMDEFARVDDFVNFTVSNGAKHSGVVVFAETSAPAVVIRHMETDVLYMVDRDDVFVVWRSSPA